MSIATYLPLIVQWPRPAIGGPIVPMFPGYLFVRLELEGHRSIVWTPGLKGFVCFGEDEPPFVADDVIDFLKSHEGSDGITRCGQDGASGQEVRISHGSFRDLRGLVEKRVPARERVVLLMQLMQRNVRVEVPERWISRA